MQNIHLRLICLLLAASMLLGLVACGSDDTEDTAQDTEATQEVTETEPEATEDGNEDMEDEVPSASSSGEPTYGGSLTMYYHEFYNYYDPAMPLSYGYSMWLESLWSLDWADEDTVYGLTTTTLTYHDVAGQIAESWEYPDDFSSLTITVREDVYFHDKEPFNGRQLTAEDIKYTYDRLLGLGSGWDEPVECEMNWPSELYMVESIEVLDDFTLQVNFNVASEVAMNIFITTSVNITGPEWDDCPQTWEYACGTGPYILEDVDVGNSMYFVKNENYHGYDERHPENKLPYIDEVTLIHIDDSSNALSQFIAGSLDWIGGSSQVLSTSEIAQLEATMDEGDYVEYDYAGTAPTAIALKVNQEPFDDVRVRIAMQKAINSQEIHSQYYGYDSEVEIPGVWSTTLPDFSTYSSWSDELRAEYEYDPEGAIALLEEAGYPDGFTFTISLAPNADVELFTLAKTYLAAVGITMEIDQAAEILAAVAISSDPDDERQVSSTHGGKEQIAIIKLTTTSEGANYTYNHGNEEYEALVAAFESAETLADQVEYGRQLDQIFAEEHWSISLGGTTVLREFMTSRINGYSGERLNGPARRTVVARLWLDEV